MHGIAFVCWFILLGSGFISPTVILAADVGQNNRDTRVEKSTPEDDHLNRLVEGRLLKAVAHGKQPKSNDTNEISRTSRNPSAMSSGGDFPETGKKRVSSAPVYIPPMRGAPVGRVAGGTRGILDEYPSLLCVLSPDHTAMTVHSQPRLYWFLRERTTHPVELTVIEEQAIAPMLETRIDQPVSAGAQTLRLADYGIFLQPNVTYRWFVGIVPDPDRRSRDILAWGAVRYVRVSDDLTEMLSRMSLEEKVEIYARAGVWYDAFACISDLIRLHPDNSGLLRTYRAMLDQIGLSQVLE